MRFTSYLIETHNKPKIINEKHDLVLQKVLDAVDNGHVEYGDNKISFDIGDMSDTPKLQGLKLIIRAGNSNDIKLGRDRDGNYAIVIHTTEAMPAREQIDTFLAGKKIYTGFKKAYEQYVKNFHDHDKEYEPNDTETKLKANSRDSFEGTYNDLITAVREQHKKYTEATAEIDKELGKIANVGRKKALELAKEKLRDDYLGKNEKEFISKIMALPEAKFAQHLDKEWKAKLEARLTSFYNSSYKTKA